MGAQAARFVESGNEWSTPWWVVNEAARLIQRGFDLDAAATVGNAKATRFFTRRDNALEHDWFGTVWLNPPFSRPEAPCATPCRRLTCERRGFHLTEARHGSADFAAKAVRELEADRVDTIAWHGPVATDTDWFRQLWPWVHIRVDYSGRIRYNEAATGGTFPSQTLILRPYRRRDLAVPTILSCAPTDDAWKHIATCDDCSVLTGPDGSCYRCGNLEVPK